ncbi:50S ribosomal protein L3 [candidate division WS5 bacterium]|uniref:Large ribosomal subunit protein uL3 n=1 Tax=candidate division WS5 bacterium TaxID=2093353 RepID=A0A419DAE2_9BACT|nr:MAG: 50S ribosomal protein L3 [candidate division WS5 bacterium]
MKAILAKKIGMTNYFTDNGEMVPVTLVEAGPCVITQIKSMDKDKYDAIQIGFGLSKKLGKSLAGHLKKSKAKSKYLQEVKEEIGELKVGDEITCNIFNEGDKVNVTGINKGKGFQGNIKRHNHHRGPMTHGSRNQRRPGSIGAAYPQHVFKGTKLPGQMGHVQTTVKNLRIEKVDAEKNILAVKGAIPGPKKSVILIKSAG